MKNQKEQNKKKYENKEALERASSQLASILVSWIEFGRSKNLYGKQKNGKTICK